MKRSVTIYTVATFGLAVFCLPVAAQLDITVTDMTPVAPLQTPIPSTYEPRYISGFGSGDSFTVFFEDRSAGNFPFPICFVSTTTGPTGFAESATSTNIADTHFCVKDWPVTINGLSYAYRAWGALENTPEHNFYVSNDLTNWTLVSTFTIPNYEGFHSGHVYYGFHDVIELNGTYYAWGECNIGYTLICRSDSGDDDWEAFARVGGLYNLPNPGPLQLPDVGTPTGSFFELGGDRGYGKVVVPGNDSAFYLAINTAARPSLPDVDLEAAFINPNNWTWHDGTIGLPATAILREDGHDLRECWLAPNGEAEWTIIYDADYGSAYGDKALGYATLVAPLLCIEVEIDIKPGSFPSSINLRKQGVTPVAIHTTDDFDATSVNPLSVQLNGCWPAIDWQAYDCDEIPNPLYDIVPDEPEMMGDGDIDLVLYFDTPALAEDECFKVGDTEAVLAGETFDGVSIEGTGDVRIVRGPKP